MIQTDRQTNPKVSVIIPCYNSERFLRECLDSVVAQTLRDIEIICVDDGSTDSTPDILREYAADYGRVKLVCFAENRSTLQARKAGVSEATGKYIMFVDADDYLDSTACAEAFDIAESSGVDIVQFGTKAINCSGLSQKRLEGAQNYISIYDGVLTDDNLLSACFEHNKFRHTLWAKLLRTEICKQAFARIEDGYFRVAEDLYAFFLIAYFAKSYKGENRKLHNYCYGRGNHGYMSIDLKRFESYCTGARIAPAIGRFLEAEDALDKFSYIVEKIHQHRLNYCLNNWEYELAVCDMAQGFDIMVEHWGAKTIILELAKKYWDDRITITKLLLGARTLNPKAGVIKTIATYFHHANNGGIQRVNAGLIPMWMSMGYAVIFITDDPPSDDDFELPEKLTWIVLPDFKTHRADTYEARYTALTEIVYEYNVDVFIYHSDTSGSAFWDMLTLKSCGCRVVLHCHNSFSRPLADNNPFFADMHHIYEHFDAVLTLSKTDTAYWKNFNNNTYQMYNPLTFDLRAIEPSPLDSYDVLWLARLARQKNPMHAVRIIEVVMQEIPNVKLHVVGKGEPYYTQIEEYIESNDLRDNVILHGFTLEVEKYYKSASVFLMTSNYEGLPLTLLESKSYGIPCVCYEMPYLDLCQDGKGIVSVPHWDIKAAAKEIVRLLSNPEQRRRLGAEARASAEDYASINIQERWQNLFDSLADGNAPSVPAEISPEVFSAIAHTIGLHSKVLQTAQLENAATMRVQRREIASLSNRLSRVSQAYEKKEENYKHKIETLNARVGESKQKKEDFKVRAEGYKQKITDLKAKEESYKQKITDFKTKEESYKQKIAAHKAKEATYKQKLDDIYRSRSWKLARIISAPMRIVRRIVSRG